MRDVLSRILVCGIGSCLHVRTSRRTIELDLILFYLICIQTVWLKNSSPESKVEVKLFSSFQS